MSQVKFGHRVVFTLLEESAIRREWRGSDRISSISLFARAPRPAVERYRKALEAMGTSTEKGKECWARFSSFEDVVADAIREAYYKVERMEETAEESPLRDRFNTEFRRHLDDQLCRYLAPLLETQDQMFFVDLVEMGEHEFSVTIDAEKGSYVRTTQCQESTGGAFLALCGATSGAVYWAITIKVTIVEVNTLEEAAGLVVAKALGFDGCARDKVDQLEIPGRIKKVMRGFLELPKMEIERNPISGPSLEGELDEENENEAAVNDWAMGDGIDLEAHGDGSDGGEGDGSEDGDDFPVMSSRWGGQDYGQVNWLEDDGEEEEEGEDGGPDEEEERMDEAQGEDEAD